MQSNDDSDGNHEQTAAYGEFFGGAFAYSKTIRQDILGDDIALDVVDNASSLNEQFETGLSIIGDKPRPSHRDSRDDTISGKLHSFFTMSDKSTWLRENRVAYRLGVVNQLLNIFMIIISVVALVVASETVFYSTDPFKPTWNTAIEAVTVAYFTVEYVVKVSTAPSCWRYMIKFLSICDILSFLPTYIQYIMSAAGSTTTLGFLKMLRLLRVFHLLSMFHSVIIESIKRTILMSRDGLLLLALVIVLDLLFFSTAIWVAETAQCSFYNESWHYNLNNNTTPYQSIANSFYWNIITITTVGYGDVFPITPGGRVVACFAAISGILILAFPITIFSNNFQHNYAELKKEEKKDEDSKESSKESSEESSEESTEEKKERSSEEKSKEKSSKKERSSKEKSKEKSSKKERSSEEKSRENIEKMLGELREKQILMEGLLKDLVQMKERIK